MSNKKFYVTSEETCERCEGTGIVYNKAWEGFDFDRGDARLFQRQHGPEERACGRCEDGKVVRRVELLEALRECGMALPA